MRKNYDYPFIKCLNPTRVWNKYSKEWIRVRCGHCEACIVNRGSQNANKINIEASSYKFTLFVTLTYNNKYIPRCVVDYNPDSLLWQLKFKNTGEILGEFDMSPDHLRSLQDKINLGGDIPIVSKPDLQKFIKRFRKNINTQYNEKIRYYAVSEYGPVHYRPHYHLLFFTNSKQIAENIQSLISKSWRFGRIDAQVAKGNAAAYVASYVNSNVSLPRILKFDKTKPFCTHSFFLGRRLYERKRQEVYKLTPSEFMRRSLCIGQDNITIVPWRSLTNYFYPKCRGFSCKSTLQRTYSYTLYPRAIEKIGERTEGDISPYALSKRIIEIIINPKELIDFIHSSQVNYDFIDYIKKSCFIPDDIIDYDINSDKAVSAITALYTELHTSKHFLEFVCYNKTNQDYINRRVSMIEEFYSKVDYLNLIDSLDSQVNFFLDGVSSRTDLRPLFYDNLPLNIDLSDNYLYNNYKRSCESRLNDSVKHKKINDENNIFNNY